MLYTTAPADLPTADTCTDLCSGYTAPERPRTPVFTPALTSVQAPSSVQTAHSPCGQLIHWLQTRLQQGQRFESLLLTPFDPPPASGPTPEHFARTRTLRTQPGQPPLPRLHYALFRQQRLSEGFGLPPQALFRLSQALTSEDLPALQTDAQTLLILDSAQCHKILSRLIAIA